MRYDYDDINPKNVFEMLAEFLSRNLEWFCKINGREEKTLDVKEKFKSQEFMEIPCKCSQFFFWKTENHEDFKTLMEMKKKPAHPFGRIELIWLTQFFLIAPG